jgi:hypothetical protein
MEKQFQEINLKKHNNETCLDKNAVVGQSENDHLHYICSWWKHAFNKTEGFLAFKKISKNFNQKTRITQVRHKVSKNASQSQYKCVTKSVTNASQGQ